ncbi:MAG: extracellular solute-binding protein, partial [Oliverpabstia sp.]
MLLCVGCGVEENQKEEVLDENEYSEEITLMHVDGNKKEFQQFIKETEEKLHIKINVITSPQNADNRHAKISTILSSGDDSVDIIAVNDEMMSEFKSQGYLECLGQDVMSDEILSCYPKDYMEKIAMIDGEVYSVPYLMDIMLFWVNEKYLSKAELNDINTKENFDKLLSVNYGYHNYGYGSAWEESYVYNDLSQFVNMFGGDYQDWSNENTREAAVYLHDIMKENYVPKEQLVDQYEQMEQKFISGQYGSIFMYSGSIDVFMRAGVYGKDKIHAARVPLFKENITNVATWQYVLNKSSKNKEAAKKFLAYAASREGSIAYSQLLHLLPARLDIIMEENLSVPDLDVMRSYVENVELKARP